MVKINSRVNQNSVDNKYEYLKYVLDNEIGCYLEEVESSEGSVIVQKSRSGEVISILPWSGSVEANPSGQATQRLNKISISDTIYTVSGLPTEPETVGSYSLWCDTTSGGKSINWKDTSPLTNTEIETIWNSN